MTGARKPRVDLTPDAAAELARLYRDMPGMTTGELALRFNVARGSIADIVRRHGVPMRSGRHGLGPAEIARLLELYRDPHVRVSEIARILGRDRTTIHRILARELPAEERRGCGRYPDRWRRYVHRADLFVDPLSDDEQWLFGLLLADGTTDGYWSVRLRLAATDRDAVVTARRIAGSMAPLLLDRRSPHQDLVSWTINDIHVVRRLVDRGLVAAKSFDESVTVPPDSGTSAHFWRGLIDGDGTIYWNRRRVSAQRSHRRPGSRRPRLPRIARAVGRLRPDVNRRQPALRPAKARDARSSPVLVDRSASVENARSALWRVGSVIGIEPQRATALELVREYRPRRRTNGPAGHFRLGRIAIAATSEWPSTGLPSEPGGCHSERV